MAWNLVKTKVPIPVFYAPTRTKQPIKNEKIYYIYNYEALQNPDSHVPRAPTLLSIEFLQLLESLQYFALTGFLHLSRQKYFIDNCINFVKVEH